MRNIHFLPLVVKGIDFLSIAGFLLAVLLFLVTFLIHILCSRATDNQGMVCAADLLVWPYFAVWFRAIVVSVFLFFVAATVRYFRFEEWHRQFQAEFKITDDGIIAMMREYGGEKRDFDDVARLMYRKYRTICPMLGSGARGVVTDFAVSAAAVVMLVVFILVRHL